MAITAKVNELDDDLPEKAAMDRLLARMKTVEEDVAAIKAKVGA